MAAGDPYPTGDALTVRVPKEFAAEFMTEWMAKQLKTRPVLRMILRDPATGADVDLGGWQVTGVATKTQADGAYLIPVATLRAVFD
jgi:hypothetical protein